MPLTRDAINCVLRYTLAQPVEMDFMVLVLLIAEYTGLSSLFAVLFERQETTEENENSVEDLLQVS